MNSVLFDKSLPGRITVLSSNTGRREQFRTQTLLQQLNGSRYVYKQPASSESAAFVASIFQREPLVRRYLAGSFTVPQSSFHSGRIRCDYLDGITLEDAIAAALSTGDFNIADALFDSYIKRITSLPSHICVPRDFFEHIVRRQNSCSYRCLSLAIMDLIPRNIMLLNNDWIAFDNEWVFTFPMPRAFLLFRALQKLAVTIQPAIRSCAASSVPIRSIFVTGLRTLYVPNAWLGRLAPEMIDFHTLIQWEIAFQHYVASSKTRIARLKLFPKTRTTAKPGFTDVIFPKLAAVLKQIPILRNSMGLIDRAIACSHKNI